VRTTFSGRHIAKVVGRSRDRGCKGHRILRRVLVGGRHLGLSRAISFHEGVVTATLAASPHPESDARKSQARRQREGAPTIRMAENGKRRQRCQRLDRNGRRGERTPTLESSRVARRERFKRQGSVCPAVIRRSVRGCREALGPLVSCAEPKTPRDVHTVKAVERARNARGTGERSIMQVAEVGRTHRAPCPPEDRKVLWWSTKAGR